VIIENDDNNGHIVLISANHIRHSPEEDVPMKDSLANHLLIMEDSLADSLKV